MGEVQAQRCTTVVRRHIDPWRSSSHPCARPAKGQLANGDPACGIHLRSERQQNEARAKRDAWQARIDAVNKALGIRVWSYDGPDRAVSVSITDLERLAERIR